MTRTDWLEIQKELNGLGFYLGNFDGIPGPMTVSAVKLFQKQHKLLVDGVVGQRTLLELKKNIPLPWFSGVFYKGKAKRLDKGDIDLIAHDIDLEPKLLKAVIKVESAAKGFDDDNRPTVLYEPHVAYRLAPLGTRLGLLNLDLASARPGIIPYPKTQSGRYAEIDEAAKIAGAEFAASVASWGLPQIMGFNHQAAGYASAVEMVRAFADDEQNQISAMAAYILNNASLYHALKRKDWAAFAEGYNGVAYRKNHYDTKLEQAYLKA